MSIDTYSYIAEGIAHDGQTWTTKGTVVCEFHESWDQAMLQSFLQLTEGKAVFGQPGVGCRGPFKFKRMEIKVEE